MESMARPRVYPDEMRDRAVRLLYEWRESRGLANGGFTAISKQLGLRRETLRRWVMDAEEEEAGATELRPRRPTSKPDRERIAELERENKELRRANEILKTAAAFFGAELDRRPKK
jgi:transposase